jgi:protein-tyrosine phosphatase
LAAQRIDIQVFPGAEARLEPEMARRVRAGDVMTLADAGRHVLVELPHEIFVPWDNELLALRRAGLVAVFAHPERNCGVRRHPGVLAPLVAQGCLLQVTAGSLLGRFGGAVQQLAERLIDSALVPLVASDGHGSRSRTPLLAAAHQRIATLWGAATADRLCCENPARIVEGMDVLTTRPVRPRSFWRALFPRRAAT